MYVNLPMFAIHFAVFRTVTTTFAQHIATAKTVFVMAAHQDTSAHKYAARPVAASTCLDALGINAGVLNVGAVSA